MVTSLLIDVRIVTTGFHSRSTNDPPFVSGFFTDLSTPGAGAFTVSTENIPEVRVPSFPFVLQRKPMGDGLWVQFPWRQCLQLIFNYFWVRQSFFGGNFFTSLVHAYQAQKKEVKQLAGEAQSSSEEVGLFRFDYSKRPSYH